MYDCLCYRQGNGLLEPVVRKSDRRVAGIQEITRSCFGTYLLAFVLSHGLNQVDSASNIVCVVKHWELYTFTHSLAASKMNHRIKPANIAHVEAECTSSCVMQNQCQHGRVAHTSLLQKLCQGLQNFLGLPAASQGIVFLNTLRTEWWHSHITGTDYLDELHILALIPSKLLHSFVRHLECIVQVVDDRNLAPMLKQAENSVTTCESCPTSELPGVLLEVLRQA